MAAEEREPIFAQEEDPELARQFAESLKPKLNPQEERSRAAGLKIVAMVEGKMKADKSLTYSEGLTQVQKENLDLIMVYIGNK